MLPWSVMPTAGMPWRTTSSASRSTLAMPSSMENSVWLWRWTKEEFLAMRVILTRLKKRQNPRDYGGVIRRDGAVYS